MPSGYDFTIEYQGQIRGYMLAREGQLGRGQRAWRVENVGASIAQRMPTEQRYGNQPAVIEAPMVFKTCHRGYGDDQVRSGGRYHYALNVDCRFPDLVLPGPKKHSLTLPNSAHHVSGFFEMDDMVFAIAGRRCFAMDADDVVTEAKDFGAGKEASACAVFRGTASKFSTGARAYVAMGHDEPIYERAPNADPTLGWSQAANVYAERLATSKDRLNGSPAPNLVYWVQNDPLLSADWTTAYPVGDSRHRITSLVEMGVLYVGKENGLYIFDQDYQAVTVTPELEHVPNVWNCFNMIGWQGSLWVPHIRGLLNYQNMGANGFVVTPATPGSWTTDENPVRGRVTALAGDNRWLYAAVLNPDGNSYILAGRKAFEGEVGPIVWHPLVSLGAVECRALYLSGSYANPRLYYGAGYNAGYLILPRVGEDPIQDSNCRYETSGSLYYPAHSWFTPITVKVWKSIEIEGDYLTEARYVDVYYRIDGGTWRYAGRADRSPRDVIALPHDTHGSRIELRLDYTMPSDTLPFRLRSVVVRGAERPQTVKVISATVRCCDNLPTYAGLERRSGAEILQDLESYAQAGEPVKLTDPLGNERWVLVLAPVGEQESAQYGDEPPEILATIQMATFEPPDRPEQYETGAYGTDKYGEIAYA